MAKKIDPGEFTIDEPAHWLYVGPTKCGKTTLARFHAQQLCKAKWKVIVFDPVGTITAGAKEGEEWGDGARVIVELEDFEKEMEEEHDAFVFVDESPDVLSHAQAHNHWMLRRGRHSKLYFRVITQRVKMIPPNVRTQCSRLFLFRCAKSDAREILNDFGHEADIFPESMDKGDCLMVESASDTVEEFNAFELTGGDPDHVEVIEK